jgi:hypothetical protein
MVRIGSRKWTAAHIGRLVLLIDAGLLGRKRRHFTETLDIGRSKQGAEPRQTLSAGRLASTIRA